MPFEIFLCFSLQLAIKDITLCLTQIEWSLASDVNRGHIAFISALTLNQQEMYYACLATVSNVAFHLMKVKLQAQISSFKYIPQ